LELDLFHSCIGRRNAAAHLKALAFAAWLIFATPSHAQSTQKVDKTEALNAQGSMMSSGDEEVALVKQLDLLSAATNDSGPEGIVPITKGFNASIGTTSQHDSAGGWTSLMTPNIAYRFNQHFSLNFGLPIYNYVLIATTVNETNKKGAVTGTETLLLSQNLDLGDADLVGEYDLHAKWFDYNLSATLGVPTGDDADALGAGQFTYAFINHFERPLNDSITPNIELGIDNSPNLDDVRVHKSYEDVGTNAHFQAGFDFSLPFGMNFETNAYEELPLTTQTITSTTNNGKKGKQEKFYTVVSEKSIGEDNGFEDTLDIPLSGHVTLSGFYNRSLRNKIDTAGFSITFLLRAPPRAKKMLIH